MTQACVISEETLSTTEMPTRRSPAQARTFLNVDGLSVSFGGQKVLRDVSFELSGGQVALLCGSNGSGKTTLLNVLSGFLKPDNGNVRLKLDGLEIDVLKARPDYLVRVGIARLWQDIRLFPTMTVLENVLAASPHAIGVNPFFALFALRKVKKQEQIFYKQAMNWLDILGMADRADSSGDKLSVGQSKRVAIARMLQTGSKVLLLDEPLAGLDNNAAEKLIRDLKCLADVTQCAMLIVEHNHNAIMPICDMRFTLCEGTLMCEKIGVQL